MWWILLSNSSPLLSGNVVNCCWRSRPGQRSCSAAVGRLKIYNYWKGTEPRGLVQSHVDRSRATWTGYTIIGKVQSHVGWSRATWSGLYISHHQLVHGSMIPPSYRLTQSCQCPPVIGWQCFHPPVIGQLCYHIPAIGQCVTIHLWLVSLPPWLIGWYFMNWQFQDVVHHWLDYDYGYADIIPYIFNNYFSTVSALSMTTPTWCQCSQRLGGHAIFENIKLKFYR